MNTETIKACPKKECKFFGIRLWSHKFCSQCGTELREVVMCCNEENITDGKFCSRCGTEKELEFLPELGNGGEELQNINPEQDDFPERKCRHDLS